MLSPVRFSTVSTTHETPPFPRAVLNCAEVAAGYADAGRGYGLADMAHAIATDRPHRASGDLAFHVLEIMEAVQTASRDHVVVAHGTDRTPHSCR
ncbi:hypothetical protein IAE22_28080 [Bacillus sp. S34]|nr:hypothetical protein [Bacillus sp. S34]